jgi:large subunit ribosomal protein L20
MTRSTNNAASKRRRKKVLKRAKGFVGRAKSCFRLALQRVEKAMKYAYRDRKRKKRDFKILWIQRINAAVRPYGLRYSEFMYGLKQLNISVDRKMLANLAVSEEKAFEYLVDEAKKALKKTRTAA